METSRASQLPFFGGEPIAVNTRKGSFTLLEVTCRRCGNEFYVPLRWRSYKLVVKGRSDDPPAEIKTASCPWCMKVSRRPKVRKKVR